MSWAHLGRRSKPWSQRQPMQGATKCRNDVCWQCIKMTFWQCYMEGSEIHGLNTYIQSMPSIKSELRCEVRCRKGSLSPAAMISAKLWRFTDACRHVFATESWSTGSWTCNICVNVRLNHGTLWRTRNCAKPRLEYQLQLSRPYRKVQLAAIGDEVEETEFAVDLDTVQQESTQHGDWSDTVFMVDHKNTQAQLDEVD